MNQIKMEMRMKNNVLSLLIVVVGMLCGGTAVAAESPAAPAQDGMEMSVNNPLAKFIIVEPIGLYGFSETENSGNAYLVMRVTNLTEKESALFGSSVQNKKMIAVDPSGNVIDIDSSGGMRYDTPSEVPVKIVMDDPAFQFVNISNKIQVMPVVKIGINIDARRQGNLTFRNVPVFWDETPE